MIQLVAGQEVEQYIDDLALLRISVFREYPYLYEGNMEYERSYLQKFVQGEDCIIAVVLDNGHVVGAVSGLPLALEEAEVRGPWKKASSLDGVYYISEILLKPDYRGLGLGKQLMEALEEWVAASGKFTEIALATVVRPKDDPRRPATYRDAQRFFADRNYHIKEGVTCTIAWQEIDEADTTSKPLQFWSRKVTMT